MERPAFWVSIGAVLVGLAILSFIPNSPIFIILKIVVILGTVGGAIYFLQQQDRDLASPPTEKQGNDSPSQFEIGDEQADELDAKGVSQEYYHQFLQTLFPLILNTLVADEAAFLLMKPGSGVFHVRYFAHRQGLPVTTDQFAAGATLPGLVFKQKEGLIENQLEGKIAQLLPPHPEAAPPVTSFVGIPLQYNSKTIGVLYAASAAEGAFSLEDVELLQQFGQLLELELHQSSYMFRYEQESWQNSVYIELARGLIQVKTLDTLWEFLAQAFQKYFEADRVAFARKIDAETGMVIYATGNYRGILPESEFSLTEGLVGWLLRNGKDLLVDDFSIKENYIPRFSTEEPLAREYRSLVGVPIVFNEKEAIVAILESYTPQQFSDQTRELLKGIGAMVGVFIEKQRRIEEWMRTSKYDVQTGLGNFTAFKEHLEKELARLEQRNGVSTLSYLQLVEPVLENLSPEIQDQFLKEYLSFILPYLGKMNYIYRLSSGLFAVLWVDANHRNALEQIEILETKMKEKAVWGNGQVPVVKQAWGLVEFPTTGSDPLDIMVKAEQIVMQAVDDENKNVKVYM